MNVDRPVVEKRSVAGPGLVAVTSLGLLAGAASRFDRVANAPGSPGYAAAWAVILVALVAAGVSIATVMRRRGYRWLAVAAALALVAFDPGQYPTGRDWGLGHRGPAWRVVWVAYVFALMAGAAAAVLRTIRRTDELEQRVNLLAAGFAFFLTLGLTLAWALLEDVLPPLRAAWVTGLMVAAWFGGTAIAERRYR